MILSDKEITHQFKTGKLIIAPQFIPENLGNASYDITIGEFVIRRSRNASEIQYPWSPAGEESRYDYWGPPERSTSDPQHPTIRGHFIAPNELVLGHTQEFIGSAAGSNIVTKMQARSSLGRMGVTICSCAGMGDIGFYNRWCMEIKNHTTATIFIPVGVRVGQIVFYHTTPTETDYVHAGHYQALNHSLAELIGSWHPNQLYPQIALNKCW